MQIKEYIALAVLSVTWATPLWATTQLPVDLIAVGFLESPLRAQKSSEYAIDYVTADLALRQKKDPTVLDDEKFKAPEAIFRALRSTTAHSSRQRALQFLQSTEMIDDLLRYIERSVLEELDRANLLKQFINTTATLASLGYPEALVKWSAAIHKQYHNVDNTNATEVYLEEQYQKQFGTIEAVTFTNPTFAEECFIAHRELYLLEAKHKGWYGFPKMNTEAMAQAEEKMRRVCKKMRAVRDTEHHIPWADLDATEEQERNTLQKRYSCLREYVGSYLEKFRWGKDTIGCLHRLTQHTLALENLAHS